MLDRCNQPTTIADQISQLHCLVQLPTEWAADPDLGSVVPTLDGEQRRFPRFRFRGIQCRAALQYRPTLPALPRERAIYRVYTRDISRGGLSFLHHEQLFPREQVAIVLLNGTVQILEVSWCRRLEERCYLIGGRFV